MQERVSTLKDVLRDIDNEIHQLMKRREHLRSTYTKSNRNRRIVIYHTICDIDEKIIVKLSVKLTLRFIP